MYIMLVLINLFYMVFSMFFWKRVVFSPGVSLRCILLTSLTLLNLNCFSMCTHQRWISSKYTKRSFLVPCGKCEACLQEKAASRSTRIRNHSYSDSSRMPLFVTLTYDRSSCPYVLKSDVDKEITPLPVYREYTVRRKRCRDGEYRLKRSYKLTLLTHVFPDYESTASFDGECQKIPRFLPYLKHRRHKVGVCYFKDIQDFEKRLRSNLVRKYNYNEKFSFYQCNEYGEKTKRPHFHVLMYIRPQDEALFKHAICEAWPFADRNRTEEYIEFCYDDAAGYVSSYVNCGSEFPSFLAVNFKPQHSHSKYFGHGLQSFSLPEILKKVDKGDLQYSAETSVDGVRKVISLPVPKYVINRWFPKFKGYSRLTSDEVSFLLRDCERFTDLFRFQGNDIGISYCKKWFEGYDGFEEKYWYGDRVNLLCNSHYLSPRNLDYTLEDCYKNFVMINNAYARYHEITGKNRYDYAIDFERTWRCYQSTVLKRWYEDDTVNDIYKYDNVFEVLHDPSISPGLFDKLVRNYPSTKIITDPNEFPQVVNKTNRLIKSYHSYLKTKSVNNCVLSQTLDNV